MSDDDIELDSPNWHPPQIAELAKRGFRRINKWQVSDPTKPKKCKRCNGNGGWEVERRAVLAPGVYGGPIIDFFRCELCEGTGKVKLSMVEHAGDTASKCWRAVLELRGVPAILEIIRARDLALLDEATKRVSLATVNPRPGECWRLATEAMRALREEMAK